MAITVKHSKVSLIPDGTDTSVVRPSDWNADHTLVGLGTMAEQDANAVAITGGTISGVSVSGYVPTTTTITAGTGLTGGGDLSANRTLAISNTGVTANSYGSASKTLTATVNAQGQLTALADTNIAIANTQVSGLGTASTKDAGVALGVATLDASGKVPLSEIPDSIIGALSYQGTWNALTNTPTLTSSVGTKGYYYVVNVAGTTDLNGITDWQVGDWAVYSGTAWQKIDNTDGVTSVNGLTGAVVLTTTNITEGTNEYFTTTRARNSISGGTAISYDNSTGVITNTAPDQVVALTGAGTTTVTGTYPNFTITSTDAYTGDVVGPASATDNAIARFDTTTGKLIQNSVVTIDDSGNESGINAITFDTTPSTTPTTEGTLYWDSADGNQTLSLVMANGDAVQQIGEETYYRVKASSAITNGQVVMFTGSVGASGALTAAPATGLTASTASYVMGVATQDIANNSWGYITAFGLVRNLNTSAFADGDILYYDPTVAGGLTKTIPSAPNAKVQVCAVTHAATNGSLFVRPSFGGALGQYEGDVQVTTPSNGQLLIRDQTAGKWVNASLTGGTAISVSNSAGGVTVTNTAPDQIVSITGGGTTTVTGTYPNFTVSSSDQYTGTVTSVAATGGTGISVSGSPITTSGTLTITNTAPDQTVVMNSGTGISVTGTYPNFTVTNTAPSSGGTVTSVSALTLGTTGTDLSSTVANSTTTPVITLNVPTASATNRGALSSTDWSTFNSKAPGVTFTTSYVPYGQGTTTLNQSSSFTYASSTLTAPIVSASNGLVVNSNTVSASYSIPSGSSAMSTGPMTVASGQTVTIPSGSRWVVL